MKNKIILFLSALLCAGLVQAQSYDKLRADSLLNLLAEKNKAMGSLALLDNGKIIYARAIGYREIAPEKIPSDSETKYRIGSVSKMFTATLIFQLIEEGKLDLSTKLDRFFPSVANSDKITIGDMLSHRSGIHNFTNDPSYQSFMTQTKNRQEMLDIFNSNKPDFEPGAKMEYSNTNFVLLGYIVEELRKDRYNNVLQKFICTKAGLKNTYYGSKADLSKNESYSFSFQTSWEKLPETDMSIPHGAGAIVSTPTDLVVFINALFEGKLVSSKSLDLMKTIRDGMGMGIQQFPYNDKLVLGHGGGIDGFGSMLCYFPAEKIAISYISNGTVYSPNDILIRMLNNYFGKYERLPEFTVIEVSPDELDKYAGVYSSSQVPISITVKREGGKLFGQGSGQPPFPLEATAKNTFKFEPAGIVMVFNPDYNSFILEQGGGKLTFTRDKKEN